VYQKGTARAKRKKEIQTVNKIRLVESLFNEAIEQLEAEGFDVYGDSERDRGHEIFEAAEET
jgi:hypothetical protein